MKLIRLVIALLSIAALAATSCGSGETVPAAAAATVSGPVDDPVEDAPADAAPSEPADDAAADDAPVEVVEGIPEGMPSEYRGPIMPIDPNNPPSPAGGGGFFVTLVGPVSAEDGTVADLKVSLYDFREEGGSVECGAELRTGAFTAQHTDVSSGTVSIGDWGKANVRIESTSHAFDAQLGEPFCDEQTGTWTGFEGELDGRTGSFHRLMVDGQELITFG